MTVNNLRPHVGYDTAPETVFEITCTIRYLIMLRQLLFLRKRQVNIRALLALHTASKALSINVLDTQKAAVAECRFLGAYIRVRVCWLADGLVVSLSSHLSLSLTHSHSLSPSVCDVHVNNIIKPKCVM
ncbi:hypothetical protein QTP88_012515 [Uroleucon formosanum]